MYGLGLRFQASDWAYLGYVSICVHGVHRRSKSRRDLMRFPYNTVRLSNLINVIR